MIPVGILTAAGTSSFTFLLDLYPGASYAYSVRKLRFAYTGNCVRIRRSSDNTETNIGFVNNNIDTTAISTFCGTGNGFVVTWYDQSGNANNMVQTAPNKQPQIYFSGAFVLRGGKICIQFEFQKTMSYPEITRTPAQNFSFWLTYEKSTTSNQPVLINANGTAAIWLDYGQTLQYVNNTQTINITPNNFAINTRYLVNNICDTSITTIYSNAIAWGNRTTTANANANVLAFEAVRTGNLIFQEFVFYLNSQASNRIGISTNINTFYTIY